MSELPTSASGASPVGTAAPIGGTAPKSTRGYRWNSPAAKRSSSGAPGPVTILSRSMGIDLTGASSSAAPFQSIDSGLRAAIRSWGG